MSDYKISILVTFYNQEKYVDKALNSIFGQKTNFKYKVIIGDDGSSDGTISAIEKWKKKYPEIELLVRDRNDGCNIGGFRASRNRLSLLRRVKTKYFIFLDGDDHFSDAKKLQMQYELLESEQNRDCIACAHDISALYPDGSIKPYSKKKVKEGKYDIKEYWKKYYFHTNTILFRSSLIKKLDLKLLENNYNDNMITFSALQFGKIYFIPKSMAVYNQTGDGIWTTNNKIANHIRNMFLYDICLIINPDLKYETGIRFGSSWLELFRLRKSISKAEYRNYYKEACDKHLKYSVMWLNYNESSFFQKLILIKKFAFLVLNSCIYKIIGKVQKK